MRIPSFSLRAVDRILTSIGIKAMRAKEFEMLQSMRAAGDIEMESGGRR